MKKKSSVIKIAFIYTLCNLLVRGLAFLTTPVFSRFMTKGEFGDFNSITSWVNILEVVVTLELASSVQIAKYDHNDNINEYLSSSLLAGNIVTLFFYAITEINMSFMEKLFSMDKLYIRMVFGYLIMYPAIRLLLAKFRIYNEYIKVIAMTAVTVLIPYSLQIVLVYFCGDKLWGRFLGTYGITIPIYLVFWIIIIIKGHSFKKEYIFHSLRLSVPLIPHILSNILLASSDRIMIKKICGSDEAAIYSLAYTISTIAGVLLSSLNQAFVPWMYDKMETNDKKSIRIAIKPYTILFSLLCLLLICFGPEIILVFGGEKYTQSLQLIPPVVVAFMLQFIYTQYVNIEFFRKKNIYISIATIISALINIGLNLILLQRFGYQLAAYTTIAGFMFMVIFHYVIVCKTTDDRNIYQKRYFFYGLLSVSAFAILSKWIYKLLIVRYMIIVLIIIGTAFLYVRNKKDLKIFK